MDKKSKKIIFGCDGLTFEKKVSKRYEESGMPLAADFAIPGDCLNNCVFCGYYKTQKGDKLSLTEIKDIIEQLAGLGVKSIRIVGEGEPLLRSDILEIFEFMLERRIKPLVFSCGDILGDDNLARKIHGISGQEIISVLKKLDVTILLKYEKQFQDDIVCRTGYSKKRNLALERLLEAGFNKNNPTKLGFGTVMMTYNKDFILNVYEFALQQNIFPLLCPLMPIGKLKENEKRERIKLSSEEMINLATELHITAYKLGIKYIRPSDFPGTIPCFIAKFGLYITDVGDIYPCVSEKKIGNIRKMSLRKSWEILSDIKMNICKDYRDEGKCYIKRKLGIIPKNYDEEVHKRVIKYISEHPFDFNTLQKAQLFDTPWNYIVKPTIFKTSKYTRNRCKSENSQTMPPRLAIGR